MMDASDLTVSSTSSDRRCTTRRIRPLSHSLGSSPARTVRFEDVQGSCSVDIHEFANPEFCSNDAQLRKQVWYSSLEIRAIKQANMDLCRTSQQTDNDNNNTNNDDNMDMRGLEHLVEGETKRRQRIRDFVTAIVKVQTERRRRNSKAETTAEAMATFSRTQSRGDRRRAQKVGKLDAVVASGEDLQQKPRSSFFGRSSSGRKLMPRLRSRRSSGASLELNNNNNNNNNNRKQQAPPCCRGMQRHHSGDGAGFQKRRSMMRRMSNKASAISGAFMGSSSRSLQSTTSSTESSHSSTHVSSTAFMVDEAEQTSS